VVTKAGQRIFWRKVRPRDLSSPVFEDLLLGGNPLANSGVVARKSVLQEIGGLCEDADLIAVEDYDAWLRVAKITDEFRRVPKVLGYYWAGGGNIGNPERTLKYLDAFERRYANDLGSLDIGAGFWWFNYLKGRAYYLSGFYGNAKKALDKIRWRQAPLQVAVKALWMRSMINLFHRSELRLSDS